MSSFRKLRSERKKKVGMEKENYFKTIKRDNMGIFYSNELESTFPLFLDVSLLTSSIPGNFFWGGGQN